MKNSTEPVRPLRDAALTVALRLTLSLYCTAPGALTAVVVGAFAIVTSCCAEAAR